MAGLTLKNIHKSFGKVKVIHGIDMEVKDGEFIVIVGPSGCGKSTLLRMIAGLENVTDGDILIDNLKVNDKEPMDRNIAMVFQNYALYPHMSVFNNMAYGLKIAGLPKSEIAERVRQGAIMLELDGLLDRKPRELSGGQRQRVAMGRAIVRQPMVFLFDEPLSNLDAKLRIQMRLEIKSLQQRLGTTSLFVTHDQIEAMTLADRMVVMNEGVAEQIGSPMDVFQKPETVFAAQFIGSPAMNIIKAVSDKQSLKLENGTSLKCLTQSNGDVLVGLRPEDLRPDKKGKIVMNVKLFEPIGASTILHGTLNNSDTKIVSVVQGLLSPKDRLSEMSFSISPEAIHLFRRDTGKRIVN